MQGEIKKIMKAENKTVAQRIAYFGAKKMEGYTFTKTGVFPPTYEVRTPDNQRGYMVRPAYQTRLYGKQVPASCSCGFARENEEYHTCKHLYWLGWQLKAEEAQAREQDAGDDYPFLPTSEELDLAETDRLIGQPDFQDLVF
jgi:hypothetical protein